MNSPHSQSQVWCLPMHWWNLNLSGHLLNSTTSPTSTNIRSFYSILARWMLCQTWLESLTNLTEVRTWKPWYWLCYSLLCKVYFPKKYVIQKTFFNPPPVGFSALHCLNLWASYSSIYLVPPIMAKLQYSFCFMKAHVYEGHQYGWP